MNYGIEFVNARIMPHANIMPIAIFMPIKYTYIISIYHANLKVKFKIMLFSSHLPEYKN